MDASPAEQAWPGLQPVRTGDVLPLCQYAALGDGRSVALVGIDGSVDWLCVPGLDSEPVFDRLIAADQGGRFSITPGQPFTVTRAYRQDSNVLEQVFTTASGQVRVTDSLNSGISGRLPWTELGRRVEGLSGTVELLVELRPGRRLDQANPWRETVSHCSVLHIDGLLAAFRATEDVVRTVEEDGLLRAVLTTRPGSRSTLAWLATADEPLILPSVESIDARIDRSDQSWREWAGNLTYRGLYQSQVRRSALALKLLLYSPTGAIAAAATMALPERVGGTKNYDYRYAWVRDVAYTIKAFLRVGAIEEARAAFAWLINTIRAHGAPMRVMFRLDGAPAPPEDTLDMPGYRGSRPVRRGNAAREQVQLGLFGDVMEVAALFVEQGHVLDLATRRLLAELTDRCADLWRGLDSGIWELPHPEHYTTSKIGCWSALNRAAKLAEQGQIDASHADRWRRERDRIGAWIDSQCWSDAKQSYTMHPGTERLDASVLLALPFGFDRRERLALTRAAIVRELGCGPLVYRYSGAEEEEGTFLACAFWAVEARALLGDRTAAIGELDALLAATGGNLGLLHEQMDPDGSDMLGNMPQALSHLAMVLCTVAVNDA